MGDEAIRLAAFAELRRRLQRFGSPLQWEDIRAPFQLEGESIQLANRARGIFKPRQMGRGILSVKTTVPRQGRRRRYVDDRRGESFSYAFQGTDPWSHDNRRLREAWEDQSPFIYFYGVSEGRYAPLWPAFVSAWIPEELRIEVAVGEESLALPQDDMPRVADAERQYRTREARERVHQQSFREIVLDAYGGRCALSDMPVRRLLEAAHLFPDGHERGVAAVTNGIALSLLHHKAYDTNLIGISPDGIVKVSDQLLSERDGPLLEAGIKALDQQPVRLPGDPELHPDLEALDYRFEQFLRAQ